MENGYGRLMHRSRIGAVFIDHPASSFDASLRFWTAATGREPNAERQTDPPFASLGYSDGDLLVELQRTGEGTPPRVHLDIDTDDVEAEVRRLEALGAKRLEQHGEFWQMVDPGGLVFCVIPSHTPDFEQRATVWD
jgi:catechol 2,3-dioxygenase-like lactoylglutathione lyase family enzyme